ncbi:hypothetical protein N7539_001349 [Penicillium diatomitis]|uniref:Transmembrane protein n=1 Tax=Penicillium diatomitis TaxID=2819901 RepID=A0A9W9XGJ4_9EURO|nr:uncharacterized protein N7539_001349 [Penicillium diatomitis]KAJ5492603.1 hypothetical protein N7539_001349 [Penicillium diatomitis]
MHFVIPLLVFLTTNFWGLFHTVPFTTINPSCSVLERALGGVQLASTLYTLDQLPCLVFEDTLSGLLTKEYLLDWNAVILGPATEPAMTISPGFRPALAPVTTSTGLSSTPASPTSPFESTATSTSGQQRADFTAQAHVETVSQYVLFAVFVIVIWLAIKWAEAMGGIVSANSQLGQVQVQQRALWEGQEVIRTGMQTLWEGQLAFCDGQQAIWNAQQALWHGMVAGSDSLAFLIDVAQSIQATDRPVPVVEDLDIDEDSSAVNRTLHEVLASLDSLRQTIDRRIDALEDLRSQDDPGET